LIYKKIRSVVGAEKLGFLPRYWCSTWWHLLTTKQWTVKIYNSLILLNWLWVRFMWL